MLTAVWNAIQLVLGFIGLWQVLIWCFRRTPIGKRAGFHREMHQLAYENRNMFNSDVAYSAPAFLRVGPHHAEGMLMAQWWYSAFGTPPSIFCFRDGMEVLAILSSARTAIKQTMAGPKKSEYKEIYDQLYPRFTQLCEKIEALGTRYRDVIPAPLSQERLPAP